ncbi:hypothetical protein [Weissella paramesenteroides]|uniref:hypothetical protein n=1 Tax=Weissella paramesenteroides TaxID=1249 RepID=UPI00376EE9AB
MELSRFLRSKINYIDIILVIILAIIATFIPFLNHFYNISPDGIYHLSRFQSIADSLKNKEIPSILNFKYVSENSAVGVAINSLYPWLTGLIFIIPNLMFQNPMWGLAAGFLILNVITILTTRSLIRYISSDRLITYTGIIIYQFNNYHFIDMYSRSAFGESIAYAFLPLVVLGLLQINELKKSGFLVLGLSMGLLINTHIISFLFGIIMILFDILYMCVTKKIRLYVLIEMAKAGLVGLIIGSYSVYNLLSIYLSNKINKPFKAISMIDMNTMLKTLFNNDIASENSIGWNLGLPVTILLIYLLVASYKSSDKAVWKKWIVGAGVSYLLIFNWWPIQKLVNTPLGIIQFYGRFFVVISLLISVGYVLYLNHSQTNRRKLIFLNIIIIAFSLSAVYQNHYNYWTYRRSLTSSNYYSTLEKSYTFNDYLPITKPKENTSALKINTRSSGRRSLTNDSITLKFNTSKRQIISLPIVMYKGKNYDIWVNNNKSHSLSPNFLKIQATKGNNTVKMVSVESNNNKSLLLFSITSFFAFSMYLIFINHQSPHINKSNTYK